MQLKKMLPAMAMLPLITSSVAANAAAWTAIYTGKISYGTDPLGLFGARGADLTGKPFSATFTFDIDRHDTYGRVSFHDLSPTSELVLGGDYTANPSPILSAAFNVDGLDMDLYPDFSGRVSSASGSYFGNLVSDYNGSSLTWLNLDMFTSLAPARVSTRFSAAGLSEAGQGCAYCNTFRTYLYGANVDTFVGLNVQRLVVSEVGVSEVPEPSAWAMMVMGLGTLGAALRTRRRADALRAAQASDPAGG